MRGLAVLVGTCLSAAVLAVLGWGLAHPPAPVIGAGPLPALTIERLDGSALDLSAYRGRPVVVNFWASWCADCKVESSILGDASRAHRPAAVVGILFGDTPDAARAYQRSMYAYPYPVGYSDGAARMFGADTVPSTYFIDPGGRVRVRVSGPLTQAALAQSLREIGA